MINKLIDEFRQQVKDAVLAVLPNEVIKMYKLYPSYFENKQVNVHGYIIEVFPYPDANNIAQKVSDEIPRKIARMEKIQSFVNKLSEDDKTILKDLL